MRNSVHTQLIKGGKQNALHTTWRTQRLDMD